MATYGFIGIGTMNMRVVQGICTCSEPPSKVVLSPRGERNARELAERFPELVTVATSNQEVVDACDTVFVAVLPQQMEEVLKSLTFREEHLVVSLASTTTLAVLRESCKPVLPNNVVKAIPLPPVAKQRGVTLLTPPDERVTSFFSRLGKAVAAPDETQMKTLMCMSGLMGQIYAQQLRAQQWLESQGIEPAMAAEYVGGLYHCVTHDSSSPDATTFKHLVDEQTPGGLNEQVIREFTEAGVYDAFADTLDSIGARLRGETAPSKKKTPYSSTAS